MKRKERARWRPAACPTMHVIRSGNRFCEKQPELRDAFAKLLRWHGELAKLPLETRQQALQHALARNQVGPLVGERDQTAAALGARDRAAEPRCSDCNDYGLVLLFASNRGQYVSACSCASGRARRDALRESQQSRSFKKKPQPARPKRLPSIGEIPL